jgi:hypothetical protein
VHKSGKTLFATSRHIFFTDGAPRQMRFHSMFWNTFGRSRMPVFRIPSKEPLWKGRVFGVHGRRALRHPSAIQEVRGGTIQLNAKQILAYNGLADRVLRY